MSEVKKEKPVRKLLRKCQRAKRRYILFSLAPGSCANAKQAFDIAMGCFSDEQRKRCGTWFIEFNPKKSLGILRCRLDCIEEAKSGLDAIPERFGAKIVRTSGTLKALRRGK